MKPVIQAVSLQLSWLGQASAGIINHPDPGQVSPTNHPCGTNCPRRTHHFMEKQTTLVMTSKVEHHSMVAL